MRTMSEMEFCNFVSEMKASRMVSKPVVFKNPIEFTEETLNSYKDKLMHYGDAIDAARVLCKADPVISKLSSVKRQDWVAQLINRFDEYMIESAKAQNAETPADPVASEEIQYV